jgi:hypothetical protein
VADLGSVIVKYRTVSIPTVTLSWVMTPDGGNDTTCSRRSMSGLTRSTNGMTMLSPGLSVRE